ncbi:Phloem protein [Parasponia andersonii]|uniref:Phloem protein n=1 Tax=Parasponia andersonii TaxID=3476 RepID=A0A2P5B9S6_PARAD|nr:Phloem protein [Parasponia andersonii]
MVGARGLSITWGDTPEYWQWIPLPESRFPEVAKLNYVRWLHVMAKVEPRILSPQTTYAAYLVFKLEVAEEEDEDWWGNGFNERPVKLCVHFEGREDGDEVSVFLDPSTDVP